MKILKRYETWDGVHLDTRKPHEIKRVSRWITVKTNYNPRKNNALWDHVTDECGYKPYQDEFNPGNGLSLDYFAFNGRNYAIDQFMRFSSIWDGFGHELGYIENGERYPLAGFDANEIFNPIMIEIDECGERVRVYTEC